MNTMTKMLRAKKNKKGFTLVELIVVLVILAILLAILVPSLVGWIAKARDKEVIVQARNAYLAIETVLQENEADEHLDDTSYTMTASVAAPVAVTNTATFWQEVTYLANYSSYPAGGYKITVGPLENGSVTSMTFYDSGKDKTATLTTVGGNSTWTVVKGDQSL